MTRSRWTYRSLLAFLLLGLFLFGLLLGVLFSRFTPSYQFTAKISPSPSPENLTLPGTAVQIQACANRRGSLYIKPEDIPVGPVYMVYKGKIIGIEFMLSQEDFINGKSYEYLAGFNLPIDHVNIGLLSLGHEGYAIPHYHVDLYTISREEEAAIQCPQSLVSPTPFPLLSPIEATTTP